MGTGSPKAEILAASFFFYHSYYTTNFLKNQILARTKKNTAEAVSS